VFDFFDCDKNGIIDGPDLSTRFASEDVHEEVWTEMLVNAVDKEQCDYGDFVVMLEKLN
jgi:Ca2+-binding EF-hand superfamily protein